MNTILVPEIQYYFNKFVKNSILNKDLTWFPEEINNSNISKSKSFIKLLFDDNYPYDEYKYLYRESLRSEWPQNVQIRLSIFPHSGKYYLCDSDDCEINLFGLNNQDFEMLDLLLVYRRNPLNASIAGLSYSSLTTNLSRLIYIYLNLKINNDYSLYDNSTLISNENNVLECIYENYIIEEIFKVIQNKQIIEPQV